MRSGVCPVGFCWLGSEKAGIRFMSHLSILPTVYTRADLLELSLRDEGFKVVVGGLMSQFGRDPLLVDLLAGLDDSPSLGWVVGSDGVLTMVGDLQRIAMHHGLEERLQRVARRYALRSALDAAEQFTDGTQVILETS